MLQGAFVPNLLVFLIGQSVAWGYFRTGLVGRGAIIVLVTWVAADLALLGDLTLESPLLARSCEAVLQITVLISLGWLVFARFRRSRSTFRTIREQRMRSANVAYLRNDAAEVLQLAQRMVRADPWDLPAHIVLARAHRLLNRPARAQRELRRAMQLDRPGRYRDLIAAELVVPTVVPSAVVASTAVAATTADPVAREKRAPRPRVVGP